VPQLKNFAAVPTTWEEDPTQQLRTLRDEVLQQKELPKNDTSDFMKAAWSALQDLPPDYFPPERAEALTLISRFFYLDGQTDTTVASAADAVEAAVRGKHRRLEVIARARHGIALRTAFDFSGSLHQLVRALEIVRQDGDLVEEAKLLNSLGNTYNDAGLQYEGLALFQRAGSFFESQGDRLSAWMAFDNAALAALRLNDFERASVFAARAAADWADQPRNADQHLWVVQGALTNCELLIQADRTEEALERARMARRVADQSGIDAARGFAAVAEAICEFAVGMRSKDAMEAVIALADGPAFYCSTLATLVRTYEKTGYLDDALRLQRRLLDFTKRQKFDEVRALFGRSSFEELDGAVRIARLDDEVGKRVSNLVHTAINQSLRAGHDHDRVFRVSRLALLFARELSWPAQRIETIALAAKLIDVGNLVIPTDLLTKARALTDGERRIVSEHARFGAELLSNARLGRLDACVPIVRQHHERWDGTGPERVAGGSIPSEARVIALCDAFDALRHQRPWRAAMSLSVALEVMESELGSRFDPLLAKQFIAWVRRQPSDFFHSLGAEASDNEYVRMQRRLGQLMRESA
jgi:tetratricopeptide (TPR) repeat protein